MLEKGTAVAGRYVIEEVLSSGAQNSVYAVIDRDSGEARALKTLGELTLGDPLRRTLDAYVARARSIQSDHVALVVDQGEDAELGCAFIVMELVRGETLEARVARGALDARTFGELLSQIVHGLGAAHDASVLHAELRPDNVLLASDRSRKISVKLLNVGLDRALNAVRPKSAATIVDAAPWYLAPEQLDGKCTPSSDVWSLGQIAFFALTGRPFWRACAEEKVSMPAAMREILIDDLPTASARARELGAPALPAGFDAWFRLCAERRPNGRFADVREAGDAWANALGYGGNVARVARARDRFDSGERDENALLDALRSNPADEDTRQVYADWLESRGNGDRAELVRTRELAPSSQSDRRLPIVGDTAWRRVVARAPVSRCLEFEFRCPRRWDDLTATPDERVRHCPACRKDVYFCATLEEAKERGRARECVAFDLSPAKDELASAYDGAKKPWERELTMGAPIRDDDPPFVPPPADGWTARLGRWLRGK